MRIAIMGSGGVGGYFGGRLAAAGVDVAFIARGAHLDAMRARGLHIRSPKGDMHVPLVAPDTAVLPFQNGVDAVELVRRAVGPDHAAGGTCYVSAVIAEPGVIRHTAMDHLIFGELDGRRSPRLERLLDACRLTNFQSTLSERIEVD